MSVHTSRRSTSPVTGRNSYGLYSYGLYSYGLSDLLAIVFARRWQTHQGASAGPHLPIAYTVTAYIVMVYVVEADIALSYSYGIYRYGLHS